MKSLKGKGFKPVESSPTTTTYKGQLLICVWGKYVWEIFPV